jgi:hypothetical protein
MPGPFAAVTRPVRSNRNKPKGVSTARTRPAATFPTRRARLPETACTATPAFVVTRFGDGRVLPTTQFS